MNPSEMPTGSGSGPLFIIGMWRSGTSLFYRLLNQHPQIALMYEGDLPLLRPLFSRKGSKRDWLKRWEFWNSALSRHEIQTDRIPTEVPDLRSGAMAVWSQYAGEAIMGEKSPDYYDSLQEVAREFPNARFIILWRDPADICRSMIRARSGSTFFSKPGILHRALIGYSRMRREQLALQTQGVALHEVQYEELVQDPVKVMTGVSGFLGIPFDPRMASLRGADRSAIYEASHHNQVRGEEIVSSREAAEVLPAELKNKIARYVAFWQEQSRGAWPRFPKPGSSASRIPGGVEFLRDEILFRALRLLDQFTVFVYCYAPIGLLEMHRARKNRRLQAEESLRSSAVTTQAERLAQPSKVKGL